MAFSLHLQQTIRLFVYNDRNKKLMRILLFFQHNFLKRPNTVEMVIEIDNLCLNNVYLIIICKLIENYFDNKENLIYLVDAL